VVSQLTGVLFGLIPALNASRPDLSATLKESTSRSGTSMRQNKARGLQVVTEMAMAMVLLIGAALLICTFIALRTVNPGFDAQNVLTMETSLTGSRYEHTTGVTQLTRDAVKRIEALPGVTAAPRGVTHLPASSRYSRFRSCAAGSSRIATTARRPASF